MVLRLASPDSSDGVDTATINAAFAMDGGTLFSEDDVRIGTPHAFGSASRITDSTFELRNLAIVDVDDVRILNRTSGTSGTYDHVAAVTIEQVGDFSCDSISIIVPEAFDGSKGTYQLDMAIVDTPLQANAIRVGVPEDAEAFFDIDGTATIAITDSTCIAGVVEFALVEDGAGTAIFDFDGQLTVDGSLLSFGGYTAGIDTVGAGGNDPRRSIAEAVRPRDRSDASVGPRRSVRAGRR